MSGELIFTNSEVESVFRQTAESMGIDEVLLYEPKAIRRICMVNTYRYLVICERGDRVSVYVPSGSADIKSYKPELKVKKSLANEKIFRDLQLPLTVDQKNDLIDTLVAGAQTKGVEVIVKTLKPFVKY